MSLIHDSIARLDRSKAPMHPPSFDAIICLAEVVDLFRANLPTSTCQAGAALLGIPVHVVDTWEEAIVLGYQLKSLSKRVLLVR
jgi:hypothetical protein